MKLSSVYLAIAGASIVGAMSPAQASLCTANATGVMVCAGFGTKSAYGDAATAKSDFLAATSNSQVLNFEPVTAPTPISGDTSVSFKGSALPDTTALLRPVSGGQTFISQDFDLSFPNPPPQTVSSLGRFNTTASGEMLLESSGDFTVKFGSAIKAFGFYGTDIGDFGGSLEIVLCDSTSVSASACSRPISVIAGATPTGTSDPTNTDASILFWGFTDANGTYDTVKFIHSNNINFSEDGFGFDDMIVARTLADPVNPGIPEPATLSLIALSMLGLGRRWGGKRAT